MGDTRCGHTKCTFRQVWFRWKWETSGLCPRPMNGIAGARACLVHLTMLRESQPGNLTAFIAQGAP